MCGPRPKWTRLPVPDHRIGKRSAFRVSKRAADVSLLSPEGSEPVATDCELPNVTVTRAASLGVNVRLALAALQNGSPGSCPLPVLTSRRCSHNLSFPAVSTCPLFTLHHFYFLPHLLLAPPLASSPPSSPFSPTPPAMRARCQA